MISCVSYVTQPSLDPERSHKPSAIRRGINLEKTISKILRMHRGNLSYLVTEWKFLSMNMFTFKEIRQTPDFLLLRFGSNARHMKTIKSRVLCVPSAILEALLVKQRQYFRKSIRKSEIFSNIRLKLPQTYLRTKHAIIY